jgi:hypothetical protein
MPRMRRARSQDTLTQEAAIAQLNALADDLEAVAKIVGPTPSPLVEGEEGTQGEGASGGLHEGASSAALLAAAHAYRKAANLVSRIEWVRGRRRRRTAAPGRGAARPAGGAGAGRRTRRAAVATAE